MSEAMSQDLRQARFGVALVCIVFLIANASMGAMPVLFGAYIDHLGFSLELAGRMATAETCGLALGSFLCLVLVERFHTGLRLPVIAAIVGLVIAQLLSAKVQDPVAFGAARSLSGLCVGLIQAASSAWIASLRHPERAFAFFVGMTFLSGAIGMPVFSAVLAQFSIEALYLGYATLLAVPFLLSLRFPEREHVVVAETRVIPAGIPIGREALLLGGLWLNFALNGGVWVYLERAGETAGISLQTVSALLGGGMFVALIATLVIAFARDQHGPRRRIVFSHTLLVLSTFMLVFPLGIFWFASAVVLFHIAIAVVPPCLLAALALADPSGRSAMRGVVAINLGYCVAPIFFTSIVVWIGEASALVISAIAFGLCLFLTLMGLAGARRHHPEQSARPGATLADL